MKSILFENSKNFKKNKHIYFGDWCLDDPKKLDKNSFSKFKKKVVNEYHWNSDRKLEKDYKFLKKIQKKIFKILVKNLNEYHNTNYSEKYWKIIILPWLINILNMTFDKWEMVNQINKKKFKIDLYEYADKDLIFEDYKDIGWFSKSTNLWIITKILEFNSKKIINKKIKIKKQKTEYVQFALNIPNKIKKRLFILAFKFFSFFFKSKIIIFNIGFKKKHNIILNLKLKQFPFFWLIEDYKKNIIDIKKRELFFKKKTNKSKYSFENFFLQNVHLFIPKSYLEDYKSIKESIAKSYWPKSCKKILTAYDYKINEQFKVWTAEMTEQGAKYIILQHGGGFGLEKFSIEEDMQKEMSDTFLTWGWSDMKKSVKKFYSLLLSNQAINQKIGNKDKILIPFHYHGKYSFSISSMPKTNIDRLNKINDIVLFTNSIKKKIQKKIIIRYLEKLNRLFLLNFNKNYFNGNISFDKGEKNFFEQLEKSKIVIHDLNSTTF